MLILLGVLVSTVLMILALFAVAPVFCSCLVSLLYTLYLFLANEEHGVHHAQEFENRFWTIFALLFSTALFFAKDSPIAFGRWSPSAGFFGVIAMGYAMHMWDRHLHRVAISRQVSISLRRNSTATASLNRLQALGIPVEDQLAKIHSCLADIDQLLIPSTINNFINQRFILTKEREIINIFEECDARALNFLISHVKLGLLFYKIKDHRNFSGQHRTELIQLLAMDRLPTLTVMSRVIVLHALQLMKLRATPRAEYWVRNVILNTHQDDLSELKTLTDAKGDYFSMNKLIYNDIGSETIRQDILRHIRKEAGVQHAHMQMNTKKAKLRQHQAWRKVLSDVDDTLSCSGGSYPAGIDKRYSKKVVYPGVLAFYRELDLGTKGPDEWPEHRVGNLVFLSARPHVYKDVSEKINFAKFEQLRNASNGRKGMHTVPSLLAGDIASGTEYMMTNDMEPLALKKFNNFKQYVSIYPEYYHVFVCDNGQGDVRAGELMYDSFPNEFEAMYVHVVKDVSKTHGYSPQRWLKKGFKPCFFRTYPEAALDAFLRDPPLIRIGGLHRVCQDAANDFQQITKWPTTQHQRERRRELNQAIWSANKVLAFHQVDTVPLLEFEPLWKVGEKVRTPYGPARVVGFDAVTDLYDVLLDWRPLTKQLEEHIREEKDNKEKQASTKKISRRPSMSSDQVPKLLATVVETEESEEDGNDEKKLTSRTENAKNVDTSLPTVNGGNQSMHLVVGKEDDAAIPCALNSTAEILQEGDRDFPASVEDYAYLLTKARIQGRDISKYIPPVLPKVVEKRGKALFTFWNAEVPKKVAFKPGDQCETPYGVGIIEKHREKRGIVVVKMVGWEARAFLQEKDVKIVVLPRAWSLLRQFSAPEAEKPLVFPYAEGTSIKTPFGKAIVTKPLQVPIADVETLKTSKGSSKQSPAATQKAKPDTIGLSLISWTLADKSHPMIYCTVETARKWKESKEQQKQGDGIFKSLGSFVSKRFGSLGGTSDKTTEKAPVSVKKSIVATPRFTQYYKDGAAITTSYGHGVVRMFRVEDGFYEISLSTWTLANGSHPFAILRKDEISHRIAKGCHEGYSVLTTLGLSGTLASVEPTTGVHIVTIPSAGMVCYLQPDSVVRPLKAAVGEDVLTAYGEGKVVRYNLAENMYCIKLSGWGAMLYAKAETFDRVGDGMQDRSQFGMNWLLRFFFSGSGSTKPESTRSRSNSIVSLGRSTSGRSQSGMSLT